MKLHKRSRRILKPALVGGFLVAVGTANPCRGQEPSASVTETALSAEDAVYLENLLGEFLFKPYNAQAVRFRGRHTGCWDCYHQTEIEGWFVPGSQGDPGRVYFMDGSYVAAPPADEMKRLDFVGQCRDHFAQAKPHRLPIEGFRDLSDAGDLALACWLYCLGEDALAAKALETVRGATKAQEVLRVEILDLLYLRTINNFVDYEDEQAFKHASRLLKLSSVLPKNHEFYGQAMSFLSEIDRRRQEGSLGYEWDGVLPAEYDNWPNQRKVAFLVQTVEHLNTRPGVQERHLEEFLELGSSILPQLRRALRYETRLTRIISGGTRKYAIRDEPVVTARRVLNDAIVELGRSKAGEMRR